MGVETNSRLWDSRGSGSKEMKILFQETRGAEMKAFLAVAMGNRQMMAVSALGK